MRALVCSSTHEILDTAFPIEMPRRPHRSVIAVAIVAAAFVTGPAALSAQDGVRTTPPVEEPQPFTRFSHSALTLGDSIVTLAREQLGRRYVFGGTSPRRGFDCSGLVKYIATMLHIDIPRTARMQAKTGEAVAKDTAQLLPGDLLTFGRGSRISHIGIYIGNGRFIHASTKAGRVIETALLRAPARGIKPWQGVRRLALADDSAAASADSYPYR
jgi:cell wall-associated NlpC family hydrolase